MKTLQESIIGRRGALNWNWVELKNPKLRDLQHLDVLICRDENSYICLDRNKCKSNIAKKLHGYNNFEAYEYNSYHNDVYALGLDNFDPDLTCRDNEPCDIIHVYRGILDDVKDYDLPKIWDTLEKRIENIQ